MNKRWITNLAVALSAVLIAQTATANSFKLIKGGTFFMGSPEGEYERYPRTETLHEVTLTHDFEIQTTEVTQKQWFEVMGNNPSHFKSKAFCPDSYITLEGTPLCPLNPVEMISWNDAQVFIEKMNEKNDGYFYRLPTEAEWEYACRGGQRTSFSFGDRLDDFLDYGWYNNNSNEHTHEVGNKRPNQYGLFDMHGNVFEWVQDYFLDIYYLKSPSSDPTGPSTGVNRGIRGGSWYGHDTVGRSAARLYDHPDERSYTTGLRLVRTRL